MLDSRVGNKIISHMSCLDTECIKEVIESLMVIQLCKFIFKFKKIKIKIIKKKFTILNVKLLQQIKKKCYKTRRA
jgi:hypothetical protein